MSSRQFCLLCLHPSGVTFNPRTDGEESGFRCARQPWYHRFEQSRLTEWNLTWCPQDEVHGVREHHRDGRAFTLYRTSRKCFEFCPLALACFFSRRPSCPMPCSACSFPLAAPLFFPLLSFYVAILVAFHFRRSQYRDG